MLRRHTGVNRDAGQDLIEFLIAHAIQFHTFNGQIAFMINTDLFGDGRRRDLMVTGDHHRTDAAGSGIGHGNDRFLSGRIHHRHEAHKGQMVFIFQSKVIDAGHFPLSEGKNAQTFTGIFFIDRQHSLFMFLGERNHTFIGEYAIRTIEDLIQSAFGQHHRHAADAMKGTHHFAVGIKGQLRQAGIFFPQDGFIHIQIIPHLNQSRFGGIAENTVAPLLTDGVRSQNTDAHQSAAGHFIEIDLRRQKLFTAGVQTLYRHFVLCQRSRFIGADHRHTAQRFHGFQIFDNGVLSGHFLRADGEDDRNDGGQRFGNGGHGQSDGKHQRIENAHMTAEYR